MLSDERLRVWEGSVSAGRDDMESVTVSSGAWRQLIDQAREANALRAEVERLREENARIRSDHATQCEPLYEAADRVAEAYRTGAFLDTRTLEPLAQAVERIDRKMAAMMDRIAVPVLPIDPEADALVDRLVSEKVREQDARVPLGDVDRLRRHVKRLADFAREARDAARNIEFDADRVLYALGDDDV